jgi:hypothetical protein
VTDGGPKSFEELIRAGLHRGAGRYVRPSDVPARVVQAQQHLAHVRRMRSMMVIAASVCSIALVIGLVVGLEGAAPGGVLRPAGPHMGRPPSASKDTSTSWTVRYPISLPAGYVAPTGIAPDSTGGLWMLAAGRVAGSPRETLFHWTGVSGVLSSYAINGSATGSGVGMRTPIVVDDAGDVWLGINSTLVDFNPASGEATTVRLPAVTMGARGSGLPSLPTRDPGAHAEIDALAISSNGSIVVGRAFATELQTVDPNTLAVETIALPSGTALAGLGAGDISSSSAGGMVAATLYSGSGVHEIGLLVHGYWSTSSTPCHAYATSMAHQVLAVSGPRCVATATLSTNRTPAVLRSLHVVALTENPCAVAVSDSTILVCVSGGMAALTNGKQSPTFSLGRVRVTPSIGGSGSGSGASSQAVTPALLCTGSLGTEWFVPAQKGAVVGLIEKRRR